MVQSEIAALEAELANNPEVPREVIIKTHLLSVGVWFSDAALDAARGALVKSYRLFSYDLVPMKDLTRREHRRVPEDFIILAGPENLRPVMVQTTLSSESPYKIDVIDGRLVLTFAGRVVADVRYPKAPSYYAKTLADGTPYDEIIAFGHFFTAFRHCQYWGPKEECKFCDINENSRQMKQSKDFTFNAPVKSPKDVVQVAQEIIREAGQPTTIFISGGTITGTLHGKNEPQFYGEYVRAIKEQLPNAIVALETNARPRDELEWYKSCGVDWMSFNMEVWDRSLFEWINPGKARRVGYDKWLQWTTEAVEVFGAARVTVGLVSGIEMARPNGFANVAEAVASTTECIKFMLSHGVKPRFNQWRREPSTELCRAAEQPAIPHDFYFRLMRNYYEAWSEHRETFPITARQTLLPERRVLSYSHSAFEDFIMLTERAYPENVVSIINERCVPFEGIKPTASA